MKFKKTDAVIFVPDGAAEDVALSRTTELCIAAHHDDIELMCYKGILNCFGKADKWFTGVVVADGAGSPRDGLYADYSDDDMKKIRVLEQKKAAYIGEYSAQLMLAYPSKEIKDGKNTDIVEEIKNIILKTKPEIIYTHNPADKHDTHLGVAVKVIAAVRALKKEDRPKVFLGCEVWRDLDWVTDDEKVVLDISSHPNIAASLVGVFDSQICGGKRYDLAAAGRRIANATYSASHGVDKSDALSYAIDLSPLMLDEKLSIADFICGYINRFKTDVISRIDRVTK